MRYAFKNSFDRAFKKLSHADQLLVDSSLSNLMGFFDRKMTQPIGLGLKRIGKNYWEIRAGLRIRVLFEMEEDRVTFYFVGNHDQIRRFVRS